MPSKAPSPIRYGLVFAFVGALLAFVHLASLTYLRLLNPDSDQLLQQPMPEGFPVPRAVVWPGYLRDIIERIGTFQPGVELLVYVGLSAVLAYALLRMLNPTFRLTTGVDWRRDLLFHTYMHTVPLIKAFLIAISALVPAFLVWQLVGFVTQERPIALWIQMALLGAAVWLLFSREGVAGDYETGSYELPRERSVLLSLLGRGAVAGLSIAALLQFPPLATPDYLLRVYRTQGYIGPSAWSAIAAITLGLAAAKAFSLGAIGTTLGGRCIPTRRRALTVVPAAVLLIAAITAGRVWIPQVAQTRYDYIPGGSVEARSQRLAQLAGVPMAPSNRYDLLLLAPRGVVPLQLAVQSFVGLDASPQAAQKIDALLRRKGYATSLNEPGFGTMHDAATLTWDPAASLRVELANLEHCPDANYLRLLLERLTAGPAIPSVSRYANRKALEGILAFPDRETLVSMGDLCARLGDTASAQDWYRAADLPGSQVQLRPREKAAFNTGSVTGSLTLNGAPLSGVRVGLVPRRALSDGPEMFLQNGTLRPFWLRWLAASTVTDNQGRFNLDHLLTGSYLLLIQLPPGTSAESVTVTPRHGEMFIARDVPRIDVGRLEIKQKAEGTRQ